MARTVGALDRIVEQYEKSTPKSRELYQRAVQSLPGGNTRTTIFYEPYPFYARQGVGCRVVDIDGNERIDFVNNYTSLILGHAHPRVTEAVTAQVSRGSAFANPTDLEVALSETIKTRLPSIDLIRYTNSGTEATLMAIRAARAVTGRDRIAKFEGGYHGSHDSVAISVKPSLDQAGPADEPRSVPEGPGVPQSAIDNTIVLPFNNPSAVESIVRRHRDDLAGIIVEPVVGAGGILAPRPGFLAFLRDLTERLGMLLIFDEVISFRVSYNGAQGLYGVTPDLTTLGKIIGGGYPVGAFGGRRDIMARFDPRRSADRIDHGGTFNANPVTLAAGLATLGEMTPDRYTQLDRLTIELAEKLSAVFHRRNIAARVNHVGSLFNVHFTDQPVEEHRAVRAADSQILRAIHLSLLNRGIFLTARGMGCLSTPMTSKEIDAFARAMDHALGEV